MLGVNSWPAAMLWQPSTREQRIISGAALGGNAFKESLNSQLFWDQSWKWRMQVSAWRESERAFWKERGGQLWWMATSLHHHVETLRQLELYAHCVRPVGADTSTIETSHRALGGSGGWTERVSLPLPPTKVPQMQRHGASAPRCLRHTEKRSGHFCSTVH